VNMNTEDTIVNASRAVVILDHLRNNRIEYLLLAAIGTVLGWTQQGIAYVQGVCV
jgi:hypothetical protein